MILETLSAFIFMLAAPILFKSFAIRSVIGAAGFFILLAGMVGLWHFAHPAKAK